MERQVVTVTEFCTVIKRIFQAEEMLHNIAVVGEISGYRSSGAHSYFNLKDGSAVLPCSCFNFKKTYVPKEGEKIVAIGSPDFYVQGGRFSFIVSQMEPQGIGLLFQRIEELKKKLAAEGIFDEAHKKPIPRFCKNIIVVTSKSGAVIRDICLTVRHKNPVINIVVKDVKVQGEYAVSDITGALEAVDKLGYDCVILARGGGSLEDLMPFYDERVVRAVYNMKTPIISAVGHETDYSLCDFAADARCATPTAAGELIAYNYYETVTSIFDRLARMRLAELTYIKGRESSVRYLAQSICGGMNKQFQGDTARLKIADARLATAADLLLRQKTRDMENGLIALRQSLGMIVAQETEREHGVDKLISALDKLNPTRILKSGYFRVYSDDLPITGVKDVKIGDKIIVKGADGKISAQVTEVTEENI